ncbi:MAG: hypothetical protein JXR73_15775 [Candidatus Omnitrophica bacterium]|nr:hypothetical protein [Candidatus Omnitrophota bacterium]
MNRDPLWIHFPRWIQESGVPQRLADQIGLDAWILFRKLIELDCDANLTPDWLPVSIDDLARWTAVDPGRILLILDRLEESRWIERTNRECEIQNLRISCPLPIEIDEQQIRRQITSHGASGGRFILRYMEDLAFMEKIERVIYLYQMLFGAKFSPRIVEDLEEIANSHPMEVIYQQFQEAFQKKAKTLAWIKSRLSEAGPPQSPGE